METVTALSHVRKVERERVERMQACQSGRLRLMAILTGLSLVEWFIICMSYYVEIPFWLIILNVVCLLFNATLIWWLASLYFERRKREKEIRKQAFDTYKNR